MISCVSWAGKVLRLVSVASFGARLSRASVGLLLLASVFSQNGNASLAPRAVGANESGSNMEAMDHFIRGVVADKMEDYYRAVFEYQEALDADSMSPIIYVALAQDYVLLGKVSQAMELLSKALDINPNHKPALELQAGLLLNAERWSEALPLYERLAQLDTTEVEYPYRLMPLYLQKGDFEHAAAMYRRLVSLQGESRQLLLQMSTALLLSDEPQRAVPYLERVVELDSTDAAAIYTLGTLCLQRKDTACAQTDFERAVQLRPDVARFWMGLSILHMDQGDYTSACDLLEKATEKIPTDPGLWNLLGTCQNQLGKTDGAIASLEETLSLDSTNYPALGVLALIYDKMDSAQKVAELYERAIHLSDSAAIFLNNYAYTLSERGVDLEHAREMAEKACAAEPKNSSYLDTMGWIFFKMGDYKSAIQWLRKALKSEPHSAPILEHLGDVYHARGSESKAQDFYKKALKYDSQNENLRRKLGS
jgi:tetratricopeptide (TPR) repeat protein